MTLEKTEKDSTNKIIKKLDVSLASSLKVSEEEQIHEKRELISKINAAVSSKLFEDGDRIPSALALSDGATFGSLDYSDDEPELPNPKQ